MVKQSKKTLEDGTAQLSQNVGNQLPTYAEQHSITAKAVVINVQKEYLRIFTYLCITYECVRTFSVTY